MQSDIIRAAIAGALTLAACTSEPIPPSPAPAPAAEPVPPLDEVAVESPPPSSPDPAPREIGFDAATITHAVVRVVAVHDPGSGACGVIHFVGAIEVEVLEVGEPAPRLGLYVSCPTDVRPRGMLTVGKALEVELYARKQMWPKPANRFVGDLPVRYVRSLEEHSP